MPALKLDTWRPSECPIHGPVHAIWLDGHYGRWSAYQERTRYTCVRFDEAGKRLTHRFTPSIVIRRPRTALRGQAKVRLKAMAIRNASMKGARPTLDLYDPGDRPTPGVVGRASRCAAAPMSFAATHIADTACPIPDARRPKLEPKSGALPDAAAL